MNESSGEPGREALIYDPSMVSWAVAEAVMRPPALLSRIGLYLIVGIAVAAFCYSYFAVVSINISGRGMVRSSEKVRPIRSLVTGKLGKVWVTNGATVATGDVLVEMDDMVTEAEQRTCRVFSARIHALLNKKDSPSSDAERLAAQPPKISGSGVLRELSTLLEALKGYVEATTYLQITVPRVARAAEVERRQLRTKIRRLKGMDGAGALANDLDDLKTNSARLTASITERQEDGKRQLVNARTRLETSLRTFEETLKLHAENQRITSPVDGIVSDISVSGAGELVNAGTNLMRIIPKGGQLVAEIDIANKDIGEIHQGLPVKLKLDAFPYQDYGLVPGKIIEVPPDVRSAGDPQAQPTYAVVASVDQTTVASGNKTSPILLGMTLSADIETRRRTLLTLAVVEILKIKGIFE